MTNIFISYSRRNKEFTQQLVNALLAANREVWADWQNIPAASDWDAEIKEGIRQTHNVLFVLSPDWLASNECRKELDYALLMGKRLITILYLPIEYNNLPQDLRKINWIDMSDPAKFESAFNTVCSALDTDLDWIKAHTRLQGRAVEWDKKNREPSFVLRGKDLADGEGFITQGKGKNPEPTPLQGEYVQSSRKDATRRQRNTTIGVATALVVSIILGVLAFFQWQEAEKQSNLSQSQTLVVNTQLSGNKIVSNLLLSLASFNLVKNYDYPDRIVAEQSLRDSLSRETGIPLRDKDCPITNLTFSPDGKWLATGSNSHTGCLWNANDLDVDPIVLQAKDIGFFYPTFSPDSKWLATGECKVLGGACSANIIHLWDVQNLAAPPVVLTGPGFTGLGNLTFIPDSSRVMISDGTAIYIWDITDPHTGSIALELDDFITSLVVSRDGKWLITGSQDKITRLWDLQDLSAGYSALPGIDTVVSTLALSEDGQWVAAGGQDSNVYLWDMQELSSEPSVLPGYTSPGQATAQINSLAFSADNHWLATGSGGQLTVWNLNDQSQSFTFSQISEDIRNITFSPDGQWVSAGLYIWDMKNPSLYQEPILLRGLDEVNSVEFSKDNRWLAAAGSDEIARLWDLKSKDHEFFFLHPFNGGVDMAMFSQDGRWLFAHDFTHAARLWDLDNPSSDPILMDKTMFGSAFSPDSKWLAASICMQPDEYDSRGCLDGKAGLLDMTNPSAEPRFIFDHPVSSFTFSQDSQWLAAGSEVVNMKDLHAKPVTPGGGYDSVSLVAFSPDGQWLAGISKVDNNSTGLLWNMNDLSAEPMQLPGEDSVQLEDEPIVEQGIRTLAFSPDSQWIATSECIKAISYPIICAQHSVKLWNLDNSSAQPITHEIELTSSYDETLTFSPDNRWLLINGDEIFLLDRTELTKAPVTLSSLAGNIGRSISVRFSADSHLLALGGSDGSIRLFNMDYLGDDPIILKGHAESALIYSLAFSPDGQWLATAGGDATVRMWSLDPKYLVQVGCERTGRNFTREEWKQYFPGKTYPANRETSTCPIWQLEVEPTPMIITTPDPELMYSLQPVTTIQIRPIEGAIATNTPISGEGSVEDDPLLTNTALDEGTVPDEPAPIEGGRLTESPAPNAANAFTEEFDGNMDAWSTFMTSGIDRQVKTSLDGGNLNIQLVISEGKLPRAYWINDSSTYTNVQVETVVTNNGNNSNGVSLVCQYTDAGWYEFTVSNTGLYAIYAFDPNRLPEERYQQLIAGGSSAIQSGHVTTTYTAVCNGNELGLSINGTLVNTFTDTRYHFTEGKIGFGASSPQILPIDVTFESLSVSFLE